VLVDSLLLDPATFEARSGWGLKPEGACLGERCLPLREREDGQVDVGDFASRLGMPIVHDEKHGIWAVGPESGGKFLASARCPEIVLPDLDGNPFDLSSLLRRKVLLLAWASW
jgi:hypothetical protein